MAFKLNKADLAAWGQLLAEADGIGDELTAAVDKFNEAIAELFVPVKAALETLNEKQGEIREFMQERAAEFEEEFGEKSERWQEGERGQAAREFIREWEQGDDYFPNLEIEEPLSLQADLPNFSDFELATALER